MSRITYKQGARSPGLAFRQDLSLGRLIDANEKEQECWLTVATLLDHAAGAALSDRAPYLERAARIAVEVIGDAEIDRAYQSDPPLAGAERNAGIVRLLIERIEEAGCLHTAQATLDAFRGATALSGIDDGRLHAVRARLTWKLGQLDAAMDQYEQLEQLGKRRGEPELIVRAWIGRGVVAHLRGNYPRLKECSEQVVKLAAEGGYQRLAAFGHHGLMVAASTTGDLDAAILHAGLEYAAIEGDTVAECGVLIDVGQLLLEAGRFQTARAAFAHVLPARPPRRLMLPAAGGLALACAFQQDLDCVRWVGQELLSQSRTVGLPYQLAAALLECATALQVIGDLDLSTQCNARAIALATAYGYHEIAIKAESLADRITRLRASRPAPISAAAREVLDRIEHLEHHLPEHLVSA